MAILRAGDSSVRRSECVRLRTVLIAVLVVRS